MTLMLHAGAAAVAYDDLADIGMPEATKTHVPVAHKDVVDMVRYALGYYGHRITEEHHAITEDGNRYFGLMALQSPDGKYEDAVGLRNAHDKTFPIGLAFGSRVFVCDNLAFVTDHVIRRKHTLNAKRELPGLLAEVIEPLGQQRAHQAAMFERWRQQAMDRVTADHAMLSLYRAGIFGIKGLDDLMEQWEKPAHDWGEPSIWRLFNSATYVLTGKVAEKPKITQQLATVLDAIALLGPAPTPATGVAANDTSPVAA